MMFSCSSGLRSCLVVLIVLLACHVNADMGGISIEQNRLSGKDATLVGKAKVLHAGGKLLSRQDVALAIKTPHPVEIILPAMNSQRLEPRDIAARARKAIVRIGWYYLCPHCDNRHLNLAGGYAINDDGAVATCAHCIAPDRPDMREGHLIASDADGNILPVTAVLAYDRDLDTAIVRVEGGKFTALPINDSAQVGDSAYLFSDPFEFAGYFSAGIVNRYYWKDGSGPTSTDSVEGARRLRMNVSTDWAPGSSGSAVLDACANVIGHVSTISPLSNNKIPASPNKRKNPAGDAGDQKQPGSDGGKTPSPGGPAPKAQPGAMAPPQTMIVLHEAVPARNLKLLVDSLKKAAATENKQAAAP